jgi:serine protease inhibitor
MASSVTAVVPSDAINADGISKTDIANANNDDAV